MPRATICSNGAEILRFRQLAGLTQDELAQQAGHSKRHIERLEAGAPTTMATVADLAFVLGCKPDELIEFDREEARDICRRVSGWLSDRAHRKQILARMERAALADLLCSGEDLAGESITCRTRTRTLKLRVKRFVTIGELAYAIGREYYPKDPDNYHYYLCDSDGIEYDFTWTFEFCSRRHVALFFIHRRIEMGPPFSWVGIFPGPRMATAVKKVRRGGFRVRWLICRFILWLYNTKSFSQRPPSAWAVKQLNNLSLIYAEANTHINRAIHMVNLMERGVKPGNWGDLDTIAWVWYRNGSCLGPIAMLAHHLADAAFEDPSIMYHYYFIATKMGDGESANILRQWFADRFPQLDWPGDTSPKLKLDSLKYWMTQNRFYHYNLEAMRVNKEDDCWIN